MATSDDQILMGQMNAQRDFVLPKRPKREAEITDDLEARMTDAVFSTDDTSDASYRIGDPDMRSIVVEDKKRMQDDESGFANQFYSSLESTIFMDNPRLAGRAIEGMGRVAGIDSMREFGENIVADFEAAPDKEKFVPRVSTYKDVDGLNSALDYVGSTLGQGLGSIGVSLAGAGAGALGGAAVGSVVPGAGTAAGAVAGGVTIGASGSSFILNYGDTYEYLMEQEGMDADEAARFALVPGAIMGALDAFAVGKLLGPAKKELSSNIIKRTGQLAARGAGTEAVTEAAQQVVQESAGEIAEAAGYATNDITFQQRFENVVNAGIAGGLTGGVVGGATSPFKKPTEVPAPPSKPEPDEFGIPPFSLNEEFLTDDNIDQIKNIVRPGYAYFTNSVGSRTQAPRAKKLGGVNVIGQGIAESGLLFNERNKGLRIRPFMYPLGAMEDADGTSVVERLKEAVERGDYLRNAPLTFVYELPIGDVPFQSKVVDGTTIYPGRDDVILNAAKALGSPGTELATAAAASIKEQRGVSRGRDLNRVMPPEFIKGVFVNGELMTLDDYKASLGLQTSAETQQAIEASAEISQQEEQTPAAGDMGLPPVGADTQFSINEKEVQTRFRTHSPVFKRVLAQTLSKIEPSREDVRLLNPLEANLIKLQLNKRFGADSFNPNDMTGRLFHDYYLDEQEIMRAQPTFDTIEDFEAQRELERTGGPVYLKGEGHFGPAPQPKRTQQYDPRPAKAFRVPRFTEAAEARRERQRDLADRGLMIERRKMVRDEYGFNEAEAIMAAVMSDEELDQFVKDQPVFRTEGIRFEDLKSVVRLPEDFEADPYDGPMYSIIKKGTEAWKNIMDFDRKKEAESMGIQPVKIDPSRSFPGGEKAPEAPARSVPTKTDQTTEVETTKGVVEEAGRFEVNMAQMAARLGQSMYAGNLSQVVIKEGIQNSFDAIKAMQSKGIGSSQIHIIVNDDDRTIQIVDDGSGMTLDIVKKAFLTLGGTHKEDTSAENSSGGHGMAKMAFLLGPERFQLETVRDGKRILIDATPLEIMNNDFKIKIEDGQPVVTDEQASYAVREMGEVEGHGTKITVKIPKTYTNPRNGKQQDVAMPYKSIGFLTEPLIGNVEVRYSEATTNYDSDGNRTGETVDPPKILNMGSNLDLSSYNKYTTVEFDWGRADLYIQDDRSDYPEAKILSSGLYQFEGAASLGLYSDPGFPYKIIVDIKPSVRSGESPLYPFNNSREGFAAPIKQDVNALGEYIKDIGFERDAQATAETFANAVSMERIDMEDVGGSFADARKAMLDSFADERRDADVTALEMEQERQEVSVTRIDSDSKKIIEIMKDGRKREKDYGKPKLEADKNPSMVAREIVETARRGEGFGNIDPSKPLFHNNTNVDYFAALKELPESERPTSAEEFFTELGSIVVEFREVCAESLSEYGGNAYKELNNPRATYASGISIDKDYHGVHVRAPYRAFFINPLPMSTYRVTHPYSAMESTLHTLLHEVTHVTQQGHNEHFTTEIFKNYTRLAESGHMEAFRNALKEVYGKHWKTFNSLRKIYGKHSTRNIGKSLEGSESRVRQGQGSIGIDRESAGDSPDVVSSEGYGQPDISRRTSRGTRPPRRSTEASEILASRVVEGLKRKDKTKK